MPIRLFYKLMIRLYFLIIVSLLFVSNCISQTRITFGSCGHEDHPLPVFDLVKTYSPDVFIFLGDNIYGDTYDMEELKAKYEKLGNKTSYQNLKSSTEILATWDDHDFGWNDAGRHYPFKSESKEIFLDFFDEPLDSERRKRPGIYTSYLKEYEGKKVQIIVLDNRTFRDDLRTYKGELKEEPAYFYPLDYFPYEVKDSTLLGEAQWAWLEAELMKKADVRIIASSTQFGISFNGYEAWANFPHEQERFLKLIKKTKANGVLFISGDVHYAEISRLDVPDLYPIYDVTSSGLSSTWLFPTPNINRIEGPVMDNHFGMIEIEWSEDPAIKMEAIDISGNHRFEYTVKLSEISFN